MQMCYLEKISLLPIFGLSLNCSWLVKLAENGLIFQFKSTMKLLFIIKQTAMKSQIVIALLLCSLASCGTIIKSDLSGQWLSDGDPVSQSTQPYGTVFPVPGAVWIWGPNWNSVPNGETRVFNEYFRINCNEPITLYVTADNAFEAYINGNPVLTGNNWQNVYSVVIKPENLKICGTNVLRIKVENWHQGSPAALIYGIVQTQSCVKCPYGTFNFETCRCDCLNYNPCDCKDPQVWLDYPQCKCGCKFPVSCIDGYYYNEERCRCECIPKKCLQGQYWNVDKCRCECEVAVEQCKPPLTWNQNTCQCDCIQNVECEPTYYFWSQDKCQCVCRDESQIQCPPNSYFDRDRCRCLCKEKTDCPRGYFWNEDYCRCTCNEQPCKSDQYWDFGYCKCLCNERPCLKEYDWDPVACQCVCRAKLCPVGQRWNRNLCKCEFTDISVDNADTIKASP